MRILGDRRSGFRVSGVAVKGCMWWDGSTRCEAAEGLRGKDDDGVWLGHALCILNPKPYSLNPNPPSLIPKPYTLRCASCREAFSAL